MQFTSSVNAVDLTKIPVIIHEFKQTGILHARISIQPAWPGGTARGLLQRRFRVQAPEPRHSFLSPYLQLSIDLSLPGPNNIWVTWPGAIEQKRIMETPPPPPTGLPSSSGVFLLTSGRGF